MRIRRRRQVLNFFVFSIVYISQLDVKNLGHLYSKWDKPDKTSEYSGIHQWINAFCKPWDIRVYVQYTHIISFGVNPKSPSVVWSMNQCHVNSFTQIKIYLSRKNRDRILRLLPKVFDLNGTSKTQTPYRYPLYGGI